MSPRIHSGPAESTSESLTENPKRNLVKLDHIREEEKTNFIK